MTAHSLRLRVALAMGLPLAPACTSTPPIDPVTPTDTSPEATTAARSIPPTTTTADAACGPDQVHEHVCGLISLDFEGGGGLAPAPYDHCTQNALPMWDLDRDHVIDGWRLGSHDAVLAEFSFDAPGTAAFEYTGTYEPDAPRCCYERCNPILALPVARASLPVGATEHEMCLPAPLTTSFPTAKSQRCPAALRTRHLYLYEPEDPLDDAPFVRATDDECCYSVATLHRCPPNTIETEAGGCEMPSPGGRPLRDGGAIVTAPTRARDGWQTSIAASDCTARSAATRAWAAAAWTREAAGEHGSVAAFARLAIDLMIHGAPAELVDAAHVAARDEIRHAQHCYGIASAFAGSIVGPGPLALAAHATAPTLEQLAIDCFRDGCVNETVAALAVAEGSRRATSPAIRERLDAIADDEARHAELSYRILAWALREGGTALRIRIAEELESVREELEHSPIAGDAHRDHDETTGLLAPRTAAAVRRRVLAEVVVPCTEALLAVCLTS